MGLILYFLRHGETTASQTGGYCGTLDPDLTPAGHEMARDFAAAHKDLAWEAVFCSPLKRAVATAQPLCEALGVTPQLKDGLREIAYGQWEGKTPEEVNREFHDEYVSWLADPGWFAPTGGERGVDIARRSALVLEEIERTLPSGNVLVVFLVGHRCGPLSRPHQPDGGRLKHRGNDQTRAFTKGAGRSNPLARITAGAARNITHCFHWDSLLFRP